jgi:hypothetical protein
MAHVSLVVARTEEMLEAVFSVRSVPMLYKGVSFASASRKVTLTLYTVRNRRLVSSEVGVRQSPACEDVSSEVEERPPLEAVTGKLDEEPLVIKQFHNTGLIRRK